MKIMTAPFLCLSAALVLSGSVAPSAPSAARVGEPLPAWSEGELDIHHINTGRGDAIFFILPDGTTLLEDASGKTVEAPPFTLATKPDTSRPPGEWVARYVRRVLPKSAKQIDYALLSHFHGDHMGAIVKDSPEATNGAYKLSGITQVAEIVPIARILDRGWPDYNFPEPLKNATMVNYRRFLDWQVKHTGLRVERFAPGRNDQIVLLHDAKFYPTFEIRNLASNGVVWTGTGSGTRNLIPPLGEVKRDDYPLENNLSNAFRLSYGKFDYYSGGDLSSNEAETEFSPPEWTNIELEVGKVCGPVDVMKADHHGSWDANSTALLHYLSPRVIVVTSRADGHPAQNTYAHMISQKVWPGPRDIFITNVSPATARTTYMLEKTARSTQGHVVIRVEAGGATFHVYVLDDSNEEQCVKAIFGPYQSR